MAGYIVVKNLYLF
ncbi:uncharacterized protein FFC1_08632 [Fusarium fujikuroi]|nr:uncharacterized protein FFC1_08632 [Fusarium fujikuroi]